MLPLACPTPMPDASVQSPLTPPELTAILALLDDESDSTADLLKAKLLGRGREAIEQMLARTLDRGGYTEADDESQAEARTRELEAEWTTWEPPRLSARVKRRLRDLGQRVTLDAYDQLWQGLLDEPTSPSLDPAADPWAPGIPPRLLGLATLIARLERAETSEAEILQKLEPIVDAVERELPEALRRDADQTSTITAASKDVLAAFVNVLGKRLGLRGVAPERYYEPDSYCLNRVLETGRGAPIALCAVYVLVAERLGLPLRGVGAPGHFVVSLPQREDGAMPIDPRTRLIDPGLGWAYADAFEMRVLTRDELQAFLLARGFMATPSQLVPVNTHSIATRWLLNLHRIYSETEDKERVRVIEAAQRLLSAR